MMTNFKEEYGEVETPLFFIEKMFEMIPDKLFKNKNLKWLDIGCGNGAFSMYLFNILFKSLQEEIPEPNLRRNHIIENMLYMVEVNKVCELNLIFFFGNKANIYIKDYLQDFHLPDMDIIIGNPPFNTRSIKKVPTNKIKDKSKDGGTIWCDFIRKSLRILKQDGYLLTIIPSIWMKPDKAQMYATITQYKIHSLKTLTSNKANQVFNGQAQTPCCYFLLQKKETDGIIPLYDEKHQGFVKYSFLPNYPIPVYGAAIVDKMKIYVEKYGCIDVIKTNDISRKCEISEKKVDGFTYSNIHTCKIRELNPELVIKYSNEPCAYHDVPKIVMAHGMYGFPYYDSVGEYGISNRDKFVICNKSEKEFKILFDFLNTKLARYLFESTRYRMKYLEKYVFFLIPNLCHIPHLPLEINDETLGNFFKLNELERFYINSFHKKKYNSFYF